MVEDVSENVMVSCISVRLKEFVYENFLEGIIIEEKDFVHYV